MNSKNLLIVMAIAITTLAFMPVETLAQGQFKDMYVHDGSTAVEGLLLVKFEVNFNDPPETASVVLGVDPGDAIWEEGSGTYTADLENVDENPIDGADVNWWRFYINDEDIVGVDPLNIAPIPQQGQLIDLVDVEVDDTR